MTDIPDDVVERAVQVWLEQASDYTRLNDSIKAAGRVFVEWEREQCAKVADDKAVGVAVTHYATASSAVCSHDMAKMVAAAIRARSEGEE